MNASAKPAAKRRLLLASDRSDESTELASILKAVGDVATVTTQEIPEQPARDLSGLVVDIKVLKVVVKVDGASTQVPAEEGRVCREDGGDVDVPLPTERNGHPGLPFVEMCKDGSVELPRKVLNREEGKNLARTQERTRRR